MSVQLVNSSMFSREPWNVVCDTCKCASNKRGASAGDAATNAQKEGFTTVNVGMNRPMRWVCKSCKPKNKR